jgi:hypothetical protein
VCKPASEGSAWRERKENNGAVRPLKVDIGDHSEMIPATIPI